MHLAALRNLIEYGTKNDSRSFSLVRMVKKLNLTGPTFICGIQFGYYVVFELERKIIV